MARVSFLINEVAIELTSSGEGATAFVEANSDNQSMTVNVLDGTAYVDTADGRQTVAAGSQTTIPLTVDFTPAGAPTAPQPVDTAAMSSIPVLPVVRVPQFQPEANPLPSRSEVVGSGSASNIVASSAANTASNTGGGGINTTGGGQPQNTGNNAGGSDSGNNSTTNNTGTTENNDTNNPNIGGGQPQNTSQDAPSGEDSGEFSILNIVLATFAIVVGILFVLFLVIRSRAH
jgi:hypothetical protein